MSKPFTLDTPSNSSTNSDYNNDTDDDDLSSLPYPQPLPRSAFLDPNFNAATYLSTLRNRHQTLSDLRAELRSRSQSLAKELLDLVNGEYQAFLGLGGDLRGGEEKVEGVRVGVLGFVKGVEGVKGAVSTRKDAVDALVKEKREVGEQILVGRQLVEVHTRIGELESALAIAGSAKSLGGEQGEGVAEGGISGEYGEEEDEEDYEDEEETEDGQDVSGVARLERLVMDYLTVQQMMDQIGREHPFLVKQADRTTVIRSTLLIDLGNALKQAKNAGVTGKTKLLRILALYGDMDEAAGAIRILKETKPKHGKR